MWRQKLSFCVKMIPKEAASDKGRSFDTFKGQVLSLMDWRKKEGEGK